MGMDWRRPELRQWRCGWRSVLEVESVFGLVGCGA